MTGKTATKNTGKNPPSREDRLKNALKANLARRKAQARARAERDADSETDDLRRKED